MKNMAFEVIGDLFVLVHNRAVPADGEWNAYLDALRARSSDMTALRTLIYTEGGGPSPAQRKSLNEVLRGRMTRAAVVSDASMVRLITTALGWFNPMIKTFSSGASDAALDYLSLPRAQGGLLWSEIRRLRDELDAVYREGARAG